MKYKGSMFQWCVFVVFHFGTYLTPEAIGIIPKPPWIYLPIYHVLTTVAFTLIGHKIAPSTQAQNLRLKMQGSWKITHFGCDQ